jgi:hypothetical protein
LYATAIALEHPQAAAVRSAPRPQVRRQAVALSRRPSSVPVIQRCGCRGYDGTCDHTEEPGLQRAPARAAASATNALAPPSARRPLRASGQPLESATRAALEPHFDRDLSAVRVHTDSDAAVGAHAVDARAYTVGNHIVFGAGQYAPWSETGQRLIAHELAHTIQQRDVQGAETAELPVSRPGDPLEREAEATAAGVVSCSAAELPASRGEPALMRQSQQTQPQQTQQTQQHNPVEEARALAWGRIFNVHAKLTGVSTPAPPSGSGREEASQLQREAEQLELRNLARRLFNWDPPNMQQIAEILASMRNYLSPGLQTVRAPANDGHCGGGRAAYVVNHRAPIHLCPSFFSGSPAERINTMVHEAAHLAGIGTPDGESYCGVFDCQTDCGGFQSADAWAHFVFCASGQTPQTPPTITGHTPPTGRHP